MIILKINKKGRLPEYIPLSHIEHISSDGVGRTYFVMSGIRYGYRLDYTVLMNSIEIWVNEKQAGILEIDVMEG